MTFAGSVLPIARCGLLVWLCSQSTLSLVTIQPCPLAVDENTQNYDIICSGIEEFSAVTWRLDFAGGQDIIAGICTSIDNCTPRQPDKWNITRPTKDTSHLFIKNTSRSLYSNAVVKCITNSGSTNTGDARCSMDITYGAVISECKTQVTKNGLWNINSSCYISKVFSSMNNYSCELLQTNNLGVSTSLGKIAFYPSLNDSNPPYASGSCFFTNLTFPTDSATYNYTFKVFPGNKNAQAGAITVDVPTIKPAMSCSLYNGQIVKENSNINCTCTANNLGTPKGRLIFYRGNSLLVLGMYNESTLSFPQRILYRNESERDYRCVLDWAFQEEHDLFSEISFIIAYGPDTASIPDPGIFNINPNTNTTMTIRCDSSEAKPNVTIRWSGRCADAIGNTCIITPTIRDDDVMITCTVANAYADVVKETSTKITVNYPPSTPPEIHNYTDGAILYAGDSFIMTCSVKGGKPFNETKVLFTCPGKKNDANDTLGVNEVKSSLTFNSLQDDDHGTTCICSALWKNTSFYTMHAERNLTVYSPPSDPSITPTPEYPFIAGSTVNATLLCVSNNTGRPKSTYSWVSNVDGVNSTDDLGRIKLTFHSLRPEHHNKTVTCLAINAFTTAKQRLIHTIFFLNVYYEPIVTIESENGNECTRTGIQQTCSVFENQPIRLRCSASSNPPPVSVSWSNTFGVQSNNITIDIQRTNRTLDNANFTCKARTRALDNGRTLVGEKNITVIVKYNPDEINMTINSNSSIFTANENETVFIECMSNGRPTPKLDLYQHEKRVKGEDGGLLISNDAFTRVHYVLGNAACEHNGLYKCIANNTVGRSMNTTARLQVMCKPQLFDPNQASGDQIPSVNYNGHPATLSFPVIAFPSVNKYNITYLGTNLSTVSSNVAESHFHLGCVSMSMDSVFNCSITVDGAKNTQKGYYTAIVSNSLGSYAYTFEVTVNGDGPPGTDIGVIVGGVVGGIFAALLIAVALFFITSYIRRRKHDKTRESTSMHETDGTIVTNKSDKVNRSGRPVQGYTDVDVNSVGNENDDAISSSSFPTVRFASDTGKDEYAQVNKPVTPATTQKSKPTKTIVSKGGKDSYTTVNKTKIKDANKPRTTITDPCDTLSKNGDGTSSSKECVEYAKVDKIRKNDGKLSKPWKFAFNKSPGDKSEDVKSAKINKKKKPKTDKTRLVEKNAPLSMKPQREAVYENVVLESDMQYENKMKAPRADDSDRDVNQDGLVYSKIQFSKKQQQKATDSAPDRISTAYALVDFTKSGIPFQVPDKSD